MQNAPKIFNKFTARLKNTLSLAFNAAKEAGDGKISLFHLIYGIIFEKNNIASEILQKSGADIEKIKNAILLSKKKVVCDDAKKSISKKSLDQKTKNSFIPKFSHGAKKILMQAIACAHKYNHKYVGTEHLLYAAIKSENKEVIDLLKECGAKIPFIKKEIDLILKSTNKFSDITFQFNFHPAAKTKNNRFETINYFCKDLQGPSFQNNLEPVLGRDADMERIIQILGRKTKNNPLLLGEAGVGKTACIYGLAQNIYHGKAPLFLQNKKIYSLDLAKILAGTIFRGEFESRLKALIDELEQNPDIILFIDEIHTIVGLGQAAGGMDAANILKPALTSGNFQCIGATTFSDYKKHLENDPAITRRFQVVKIEEPKEKEAVEILKGIKKNYENFHRIKISDEAIIASVKLSSRYIPEKFLPDKAIDVLDETAASKKLETRDDYLEQKILSTKKILKSRGEEKKKKIIEENYKEALAVLKEEEFLKNEIIRLNKTIKEQARIVNEVKKSDVARTISQMTKIPVSRLEKDAKEKLLNLEKKLQRFVIGQEEACKTIATFIMRSRAGVSSPKRPIGSFMFLGPTGVGKTELAKVLAKEVFDDGKALIRFDMSEFSEKFNASKLIGAPAGYVGYEEGGKLTEAVRKKPYSVLLFDEIEKAHPEIFNLLLSILDEGHLTDAKGIKVDFKNTIIIMTSNTGTRSLDAPEMGFGKSKNKLTEREIEARYKDYKEKILIDLKKDFRPEFLNRIDKIIIFKPLDQKTMEKIVDLRIEELNERLLDLKIKIKIEVLAKKELARLGFNIEQGARPLRRVIQDQVEDKLAEGIVRDKFKTGDVLLIMKEKNSIAILKSDRR